MAAIQSYVQQAIPVIRRYLQSTILAVLPPRCGLCQQTHPRPTFICDVCIDALPLNSQACRCCAEPLKQRGTCVRCKHQKPPYSRAIAPFLMSGGMQQLIHQWKFEGKTQLSTTLASLLIKRLVSDQQPEYLIPVASHWRRRWARGFDQTWLLSNNLSHLTGIKTLPALKRARLGERQHQLSRQGRDNNMRSGFVTSRRFNGEHVALIDDVITTGATVNAATHALRRAGAGSIEVWCLARTPAPALKP